MGHLFVSYSRQDKKIVKKLVSGLEKDGHDVWLDTEDIQGGDQWRQAIVNAIKNGYALIVAISPRSVSSRNVRKELDVAEQARVRIIPVRLTQAEIPDALQYQLAGVQEVDLSANFKNGIERLKKVLGDDSKVVQDAGKRRKKRLLILMAGGAIFGLVNAYLFAGQEQGAGVPYAALAGGAVGGALLGFLTNYLFKLIGWVYKLVFWAAVLLAGVLVGGNVAEKLLDTDMGTEWEEWSVKIGSLEIEVLEIGVITGAVVAVICVLLFKSWRKKRKRAKLAALAAKAKA